MRERSASRDQRVADLLEPLDTFSGLRNALRHIAKERGHWAGVPMPMQDNPLVVEPKYPHAQLFESFYREPEKPVEGATFRNRFYSRHRRCDIYVYEEGGRVKHGWVPRVHGFTQMLNTIGASYAWGIEQESKALQTLGTLVKHHTFKQYLLTGMFIETSKRSGLTYVFRKLRPTVVLDIRAKQIDYNFGELAATERNEGRIMGCLCLHPIAYYQDSWAGAMCPTDDVIAHLMLMRGDEPMFWRRANQHSPAMPEAGL